MGNQVGVRFDGRRSFLRGGNMEHQIQSIYLDTPHVEARVFDLIEPKEITQDVAVFIIHGGGWRWGTRTLFHSIMQEFANRGYLVVSTDYRLDAKDAFVQIADVRESYDRLISYLKEKNRPLKVAVYGESAGAHLASMLVCTQPGQLGETCNLKNNWVNPYCGMLQATPIQFTPWEDIQTGIWSNMQSIAGVPYEENPEPYERLSLIEYINESNPRLFFLEAELEHLFASEKTRRVAQKHRQMGIATQWKIYPKAVHGFFYELTWESPLQAMDDICLFIDGKLTTDF